MSGMWQVWKQGDSWWACRWVTDQQEYEGPFDTKDAALAWARRR